MLKLKPKYFASAKVLQGHLEKMTHYSAPTVKGGHMKWTILVEFLQEPKYDQFVPVAIDFLVDEAPYERLEPGETFHLHEGGPPSLELIFRGELDVDEGDLIDWYEPEEAVRVEVSRCG